MAQGSFQYQGTQRRACGPGAHWNVQVVRDKVTTRCLWYACEALGIGLLLMLLGACMATIGFIVVAACVMTFEARDNAAKVVPARFRFNQPSTIKSIRNQRNRRSISSQTTKWDHQLGVFRMNRSPSPSIHEVLRKQLTAEFMQFSKEINEKQAGHSIKKSPSAPTLVEKKSPRKRTAKYAGCALLNPELLQRHALSVDNPSYSNYQVSRESLEQQRMGGSQVSMAMDLHIPNKGPVTLKIKDRSDTSRRHQLLRQTKVEYVEELDELRSPVSHSSSNSPGNRNSLDDRHFEDLASKELTKISRRMAASSFLRMSVDKAGNDRRVERSMGNRKASLEFRRSPDFRRGDYRKLSVDRFSVDCTKYFPEELGIRSRTSSGENLKKHRQPKLYQSISDDNKRQLFKNRKDDNSSRHSLNTQAVIESGGSDFEFKYYAETSLDTEESRADYSDESHATDFEESAGIAASEGPIEAHALLEVPELENLQENNRESKRNSLILDNRVIKKQFTKPNNFGEESFDDFVRNEEDNMQMVGDI
ncbi:uncharacterized protein LOC143347876 isoform X2 [Colletes latitarsis]|uniref:uncharacterized protein LOC143347876 isoform X2 n=1 Tax=Colletes latitarsis TaxID=2605962 RepID=UPI0040350510